ncbi:chitotriosidase-1-like isoform X1 [Ornithodoros turicata]|uniref:chitotriosidase-1-like isoform X1 n=1 Tax=Ornithodoros turicata TaxID=34597 RepID=UPI00313A48FC
MEKGNRQDGFLRVCYYAWGRSDLLPHEIDTSLCTHLILGFVEVKDNIIHKGSTSGEEAYRTMGEMKKRNPALKVMVSVGGGGNADGFHSMVASAFGIDAFTESVISTLREHGLDGIDIDWEFPNMVKHGKRHFTRLIQRLNAAFCDEARTAGKDKLLLSAAVAPQSLIIRNSYDIPEVSRCVDFINLMTYDLHLFKWYFPFSGHNAPLCARKKEVGYFSTLNVKRSAELWLAKGCPKSKLIIGIPTYGLSWKLGFKRLCGIFCPTVGKGPTGGGYVTYPEVSQFIEKGAKRVFDKQSCVPYACDGKTWVSYDDLESIEAKTRWIISEDFGGIMTFSLNYDDHKGTTTGGVTFPLHKKIKEICESPLPA